MGTLNYDREIWEAAREVALATAGTKVKAYQALDAAYAAAKAAVKVAAKAMGWSASRSAERDVEAKHVAWNAAVNTASRAARVSRQAAYVCGATWKVAKKRG